ncbi:nucleotidyltransferase domain-containing protein [Fusibacter bizertensis]
MPNVPIQIENAIKEYLSIISKMIPIDKAVLFGSYAKGNYNEDSDIDLAIFSSAFNNQNRIESFRLLFLEAMNFPIDLQPQPFTEDDLLNPEGLVKEIFRTGIELKM